jgi:hypothetical protein
MMFKKNAIDLILSGKKTMTSRDKQLYKTGDITNLTADKDYSKISGKYIKITKVYKKILCKFTNSDANKEGFESLSELKQYWEKNIGKWVPDNVVWVHGFEVVELNS